MIARSALPARAAGRWSAEEFMDYRSVLLVGMLSAAALVGAATSCSAPDPGQVTFIERPRGSGGELSSGGTSNGGVEAGTVTEGGVTTEAGVEGGTSSGDPVFGTSAFAAGQAGPPVRVAKAANPAHNGDASGKDCVVAGCHLDARAWAFGGTLYTDATGTARTANAEIRINGPDGKLVASTYSDVDGNFWFESSGDPKIPAGSRVGVRTAGKVMDMGGTIGGAQIGCQSTACHGAGNPGKVFVK
jgi:hypothetical protein